jgi:hypothetical protein
MARRPWKSPPDTEAVRRRIRLWTLLGIAVAGGAMGAGAIGILFAYDGVRLLGTAVMTGVLCGATGSLLLRARRPWLTALGIAPLIACLNSPACFAVVAAIEGDWGTPGMPGSLAAATLFGAPIASALGLVFGLLFLLPALSARRHIERPSLEGPGRVASLVGGWLILLALPVLCLAFASLGASSGITPMGRGTPELGAYAMALGIVGATLCLIGGLCIARYRWLAHRARRGSLRGWTIVDPSRLDLAHAQATGALLPLTQAPATGKPFEGDVLTRVVVTDANDPYRRSEQLLPYARLSR